MIQLQCPTCTKPVHRCPARAARHTKHYCNMACVKGEKYTWIPYLLAAMHTTRLADIAAYIGAPKATIRTWAYVMNPYLPADKQIHFVRMRVSNSKDENPDAQIPNAKFQTPKTKEVKARGPRRTRKPEPQKFETRVVDTTHRKWVRIDRRTIILVEKDVPDEVAIERWYGRRG